MFSADEDWFSGHIPIWDRFTEFVRKPDTRVSEIGSWKGRSIVNLLSRLVTDQEYSELVCIDHFDFVQNVSRKTKI